MLEAAQEKFKFPRGWVPLPLSSSGYLLAVCISQLMLHRSGSGCASLRTGILSSTRQHRGIQELSLSARENE